MKNQLMIALLSIAPALGVVAQDKLYKDEFPLGDITLLDGPLKHARDLNVQVTLITANIAIWVQAYSGGYSWCFI